MRVRIPKTTNMAGVWSLVLVAICLLLVMFSFVIVGAVLMTYNLTPESQLVSQYNTAVIRWNNVVRARFSILTFQATFSAGNKVPLTADTSADPVPAEPNIIPYEPLKDISASNNLLDGTITYQSGMMGTFTVESANGAPQTIDVPIFQTYQQLMTGPNPQMQCDNLNGHYLLSSGMCQTYWAVSGFCVVYDSLLNQIARVGTGNGCTAGIDPANSSPFPGQWASGIYTKLKRASISSGLLQPQNMQPSTSGTFMVRDISDPFVQFEELSEGTLDFSNLKTTHKVLGIVFLCVAAVPAFFLLGLALFAISMIVGLLIRNNIKQKRSLGGVDDPRKGLLLDHQSDVSDKGEEVMDEPESGEMKNPLEYGQKH